MKKLKELRIVKKQLDVIENSNEDLEINNLFITDARNFKDNFYLENIKFFIKKKCLSICEGIIRNFNKEIEPYIEELINVIADSHDYNIMINLLNYDEVQIKDKDKKILKNFNQQKNIMLNKIIDSNDPIVYLRAAIYYYGMTWGNMNWIPYKKRREIENIILSYDFKKFNLNFDINMYYDRTVEPYSYFELLLKYCRDYYKVYWEQAEQKVFKFVPVYMNQYIEEVIKGKNERIEDILFEMNIPYLYFNYAKNNLKKDWEDFRKEKYLKHSSFPIKEEIIDAALDSISSDTRVAMEYANHILNKPWENFRGIIKDEIIDNAINSINSNYSYAISYSLNMTKKPLDKKVEQELFNNFYNDFLQDDLNIFELPRLYEYVKDIIKIKHSPFEEMILKINDHLGGSDFTHNEDNESRCVLNEIILHYTVTNRNKIWKEIGIKNKEDLNKLKNQVMLNDNRALDEDTLELD